MCIPVTHVALKVLGWNSPDRSWLYSILLEGRRGGPGGGVASSIVIWSEEIVTLHQGLGLAYLNQTQDGGDHHQGDQDPLPVPGLGGDCHQFLPSVVCSVYRLIWALIQVISPASLTAGCFLFICNNKNLKRQCNTEPALFVFHKFWVLYEKHLYPRSKSNLIQRKIFNEEKTFFWTKSQS